MADRLVLAVKDRNIRMLYLNAEVRRDQTRAELTHTLDNIYKALAGENGAIARIEKAGLQIGQTEPFEYTNAAWNRVLKLVVLIGSIALIALTIGVYIPQLLLPVTIIGYVGAAGLYFCHRPCCCSWPHWGQRYVLHLGWHRSDPAPDPAERKRCGARSSCCARDRHVASGRGHLVYRCHTCHRAAERFALYARLRTVSRGDGTQTGTDRTGGMLLLFLCRQRWRTGVAEKNQGLSWAHIQVGHVLLALVLGLVGLYYLSRAGNQGQVLPLERIMRAALENALVCVCARRISGSVTRCFWLAPGWR